MQIGLIGLGRMGGNMTRRLVGGGHDVVVWDQNADAVRTIGRSGATGGASISDLVSRLALPRAVWVMVPSGDPTEQTVTTLAEHLQQGDTIIDGGNTHFKDDVRRASILAPRGIHYLDVGTSGGVWGAERGYCLMIGGPEHAATRLVPIFRTLAPGQGQVPPSRGLDTSTTTAHEGFLYCGPSGAGHFVKMIHNGIEYGLMQSFAEGFDILRNASASTLPEGHRYNLNLAAIAELWRRGSVVSSWLLDLAALALTADPQLE